MNWVFKSSDIFPINNFISSRIFPNENNDQMFSVTFDQKSNFTGKEGEYVLVLDDTSKGFEFVANYQIENIKVIESESEKKQITVTLKLLKRFEGEKLLEDYIYSLGRITNFKNPKNHFNRKYNRLFDEEYDAIIKDQIYLKRTILGTVLNAMHGEHQRAYLRFIANEAPEILAGKTDLDKSFELLLQYLDFAVIKPALYLRESVTLMESFIDKHEISEIGFADDAENISPTNTQMIMPQFKIIERNLNVLQELATEILKSKEDDKKQSLKFKKLFKNAFLPITLK